MYNCVLTSCILLAYRIVILNEMLTMEPTGNSEKSEPRMGFEPMHDPP